jgi:hypothetical protein
MSEMFIEDDLRCQLHPGNLAGASATKRLHLAIFQYSRATWLPDIVCSLLLGLKSQISRLSCGYIAEIAYLTHLLVSHNIVLLRKTPTLQPYFSSFHYCLSLLLSSHTLATYSSLPLQLA